MPIKILKLSEVISEKYPVSSSKLYLDIQNKLMVPPVKIGARASGFIESEIDAIVTARIRGCSESEIKSLVSNLVQQRQEIS